MLAPYFSAKDEGALPTLLVVHTNVVLYAFAFWVSRPVLAFRTKELLPPGSSTSVRPVHPQVLLNSNKFY